MAATFDIDALAAQNVQVVFDGQAPQQERLRNAVPGETRTADLMHSDSSRAQALQQQLDALRSAAQPPPLDKTLAADFERYKQAHGCAGAGSSKSKAY